ncbi:hypothetical protein CEXT_86061 [Caerostris extrusa]|uniref:Uncharacterized protein n=1 Tax=Caerostris extrusa TaxID=172846 RepID=A0AAV4SGN6_CAEEX|nr:hypothetical protein CEXT_86061 [Caerostris extrusa]
MVSRPGGLTLCVCKVIDAMCSQEMPPRAWNESFLWCIDVTWLGLCYTPECTILVSMTLSLLSAAGDMLGAAEESRERTASQPPGVSMGTESGMEMWPTSNTRISA